MTTENANGTPTLSNPSTPATIDAGTTVSASGAAGDDDARAYESTASDRAALAADELVQINLDIQVVITTALRSAVELDAMHGDIAKMIPSSIAGRFARLKTYAEALSHAQGVFLTATKPQPDLPVRHDHANKLRLLLASDAVVLAQRGLVDQRIIDQLKGPVGYLNTVSDLSALITLYRMNWSKLGDATAIKAADLDEAQRAFESLRASVVARSEQPALVDAATDERQRAYLVVLNAYDQARRAVSFIRWDQEDVEKYVPSLWAGRGMRPKKEPVTPPSPPAPAPPATTTAPVDHNMPGGSPFAHN